VEYFFIGRILEADFKMV